MATTYKRVVEYLARTVLSSDDVRFKEEVVRVENVERSSRDRGVMLETASGFRATVDHVVMTTPLGWLQQHKDVFQPPMPPELSEAIDSIHYGHLEKAFVHFPKAFWDDVPSDGLSQSDKFATDSLWTMPEYAKDTNPDRFNMEATSFSTMPEEFAHATLCFWLYGDCSRRATQSIQMLEPHSADYNSTLEALLKPYYSLLPNYNHDTPDCCPDGFLLTDWTHDAFAGNGSYTTFQVGLKNGRESLDLIQAGMGSERQIWLAGEHTAPFKALGTIVGAYWGGERVGRKIASLYGLCESPEFGLESVGGAPGPGDDTDLGGQVNM